MDFPVGAHSQLRRLGHTDRLQLWNLATAVTAMGTELESLMMGPLPGPLQPQP